MSGPEDVTISQLQGITIKVSQAADQLQKYGSVTITAINTAISQAINLVELLKHRVKGLHQQNSFEKVVDSNKTRVVFKLSYNPLDASSKGYQRPIPENEVQEKSLEDLKKPPRNERREENKPVNTEKNQETEQKEENRGTSERRVWRGGRFERRGGRFERRGGRFERRGGRFERRGGRFERRGGRFERRGGRFERGGRYPRWGSEGDREESRGPGRRWRNNRRGRWEDRGTRRPRQD